MKNNFSILRLVNVFFKYNHNKEYILNDITLDIKENEFILLLGPSGSGKTTLIQMFNGLLYPLKGSIYFYSKKVNLKDKKLLFDMKKRVSIVFQYPEHQLFEDSVKEELMFGLKNLGYSEKESIDKIKRVFDLMQLDYNHYINKYPFHLSGGEKRLIAFASILVLDPQLLVLDEPTVGLDKESREKLLKALIKFYTKDKKSIVVITHYLRDFLDLSTRFIYLKDGFKVFDVDREKFLNMQLYKYEFYDFFEFKLLDILKKKDFKLNKNFKFSSIVKYFSDIINC